MSKRMATLEEEARRMSDECLVLSLNNAWLMLFADGLLGHRPPWAPDGSVPGPWEEHTAYKREILRRMSGK